MRKFIFIVSVAVVLPFASAEQVAGPAGKVYAYKNVDGVARELKILFPLKHLSPTQWPMRGQNAQHTGRAPAK